MTTSEHVSLREHTTFKTGGGARYLCEVQTLADLEQALQLAKDAEVPWLVVGEGSNLLVADEGYQGVVMKLQHDAVAVQTQKDAVYITVGAGKNFDELVAETVQRGWWGLENLSHIPGSVGATPVQNVGAYGVEVSDLITAVEVFDVTIGKVTELTNQDCRFEYRHSRFKDEPGRYIVWSVTYQLSLEPQPVLHYKDLRERFGDTVPTQQAVRDAVIDIRAGKFPDWHTVGTAGSFFKNPLISLELYHSLLEKYPELPGHILNDNTVKIPLGWILDKVLHLKGVQDGAVGCYEGQALVIVHDGSATSSDIVAFAHYVGALVFEVTGITIEWEVTPVGFLR